MQKLDDLIMDQGSFKQIVSKSINLDPNAANKFLAHLANGLSDLLGSVSHKQLSKLVSLQTATTSEMEYSKTMASQGGKKLEFGFLRSSPLAVSKKGSSVNAASKIVH